MHALRQGRGEAVEEGLHGGRADLGHDEGEGLVGAGADSGVDPGGGVAVVDRCPRGGGRARTRPGRRGPSGRHGPRPGTRAAPPPRDGAGDLAQRGGETPFLNRSCAALSALRVAGPGLLPGEVERLDQPPHAALAVDDAEALLGDAAEVDDAPGRHPVALRVGAAQHDSLQRRLLALAHPGPTAGAGLVAQALHPFGVEADHPVPQRLPVHPRRPGRRLSAHAIQHVGQRDQPRRHPAISLPSRQAAQLRRLQVRPDRQWRAHPVPSVRSEGRESRPPRTPPYTGESAVRAPGISSSPEWPTRRG